MRIFPNYHELDIFIENIGLTATYQFNPIMGKSYTATLGNFISQNKIDNEFALDITTDSIAKIVQAEPLSETKIKLEDIVLQAFITDPRFNVITLDDVRAIHHTRNNNQSTTIEYDQLVLLGYTKLTNKASAFHQIGLGNEDNVKWVSADGRSEYVFRETNDGWQLVTDDVNLGTFNFARASDAAAHLRLDVFTWILFGNTPADESSNSLTGSFQVRLEAYREAFAPVGDSLIFALQSNLDGTIDNLIDSINSNFRPSEAILHADDVNFSYVSPIDGSSSSETLAASNFSATLYNFRAFGGDDIIVVPDGISRIDGGSGNDTVVYTGSTSGVTLNLTLNHGYDGFAESDYLINIENIRGSSYADVLVGDGNDNILDGLNGIDILYGLGGSDELNGGALDDTLYGGRGNDTIDGGSGRDIINGGPDNDTINGGTGLLDIAIFSGNRANYSIVDNGNNTFTITDNVGIDGIDTLSGIEFLNFADQQNIRPEDWANTPNTDPTGGGNNPTPDPQGNALPDLIISSIELDSPTIVSGDQVTVTFTITNDGTWASATAPTGLYLSRDNQVSSDDILLGAILSGNLSVGQSHEQTITRQTADWGEGTYYVYVAADTEGTTYSVSSGRVLESDGGNNISPQILAVDFTASSGGGDTDPGSGTNPTDPTIPHISTDFSADQFTSQSISVNSAFTSAIDYGNDKDWVEVTLVAGQEYNIRLDGVNVAGWTAISDTFFRVRDANGNRLSPSIVDDPAYNDANGLFAELNYTATYSGTHYISIGAGGVDGVYQTLIGGYQFSIFEVGQSGAQTADLIITNFDIDQNSYNLLENVNVDFTIENQGDVSADYIEIKFYISDTQFLDGSSVYLGSRLSNSNGLDSGETWTSTRAPEIPAGTVEGNYYILAVVDPDGDVEEGAFGESNNVVASSRISVNAPRGADLEFRGSITLDDTTIENGGTTTVRWIVENDGDVDAGSSETHLYISSDTNFNPNEDIYLDRESLSFMSIDEQDNESETITIPFHLPEGEYYIIAILDALSEIPGERDNDNVRSSAVFTVTDNTRPDLIITNPEFEYNSLFPNTIIEGQEVRINYDVTNIGAGATDRDIAGNFPLISAFLSTDPFLSSDDVYLEDNTVNLDPGEIDGERIYFTIPDFVEFGDYYVILAADAGGTIPEEYEDNNNSIALQVSYDEGSAGTGPDLYIINIELVSTVVSAGQQIDLRFDHINYGNIAVDADRARTYLSTSPEFDPNNIIDTSDESVGVLEPGEWSGEIEDFYIAATVAPGTYYLFIEADPNNAVQNESNENNNLSGPIEIIIREPLPIFTEFADTITLNYEGTYDALGGNDFVNGSGDSETILGGLGNDILVGNAGDDTLNGGSGDDILAGGIGADILIGGEGIDMASYRASFSSVTVRLYNGTGTGGLAEGDSLIGVESVVGSQFADILIGSSTQDDILDGVQGNDSLFGLAGNDTLRGGEGADILNGGASLFDVADYSFSGERVTVRLYNGTGIGGDAQGDTLIDIEGLIGSFHNDTLIGSSTQIDVLQGRFGDDSLFGLAGNDTLIGGPGADIMDGGAGNADMVDYIDSLEGVAVRLYNGTGVGGDAQGDTLFNIESVMGSQHNDTLVGSSTQTDILRGNSGNDGLFGLAGNDILEGGIGNDILVGGYGADRLNGGVGDDLLTGGVGPDAFIFGADSGNDTIADFDNGMDRLDVSGLAGINQLSDFLSILQDGNNVVIAIDENNSITLENFDLADVDASDFIF